MDNAIKKIAVCTDFTSIAQHAFEEALDLARVLESETHLIHVLSKDTETLTTAEQKMVDMVKKAESKAQDLEIKFHVVEEEDDIVTTLHETVNQLEPLYFIVGYEVKKGLDRFFGPSLMKIARQAKVPVIAIKEDENLKNMKRIVFPLNLWDFARQKTFATIRLAQDLGASIDLVAMSVNHTAEDDRKLKIHANQISEQFKEAGIDHNVEWLEGKNEVNLVVDYANINNADLIAKVWHHDPSLIDMVMGNQDEELLAKTNMPLFIVKSYNYMSGGSWGTMRG